MNVAVANRIDRNYREAVEAELEHWPHVAYEYEHGGKHPRMRLSYKSEVRIYGLTSTSSYSQGPMLAAADVRRICGGMGAKRESDANARKPVELREYGPKHKAAPRPVRIEKSEIADRPDPLKPLRLLRIRVLRETLSRWSGKRVNQERLEEAARILLSGWHPEIIECAVKLINEAKEEQ